MSFFDFDNDGDFGLDDAALLGGMMGFAEESIREEEKIFREEYEDIEINPDDISDVNMRLFYNGNPDLFKHIINTVRRHAANGRMIAQMKKDKAEVQHELDAMAKTEKLIVEDEQ